MSSSSPNPTLDPKGKKKKKGVGVGGGDWFQTRFALPKSPNGSAPTYFPHLLHLYYPSRQLRSSADTRMLRIPSFCTKFSGKCSFLYKAPATWNQLPASICHASSVSSLHACARVFAVCVFALLTSKYVCYKFVSAYGDVFFKKIFFYDGRAKCPLLLLLLLH